MNAIPLLLPVLMLAAEDKVVFEDPLRDRLKDGWAWLREEPGAHRMTKDGLEIRILPGNANTVRNALLRSAPDRAKGTYAVEVTVTSLTPPIKQWEQAGFTWYVDDKPVFKLVKEMVDGKVVVWPGAAPDPGTSVRLRIVVSKDAFIAQYKPDGKFEGEWKTADRGTLAPPKNDKISLQCYHGHDDKQHWVRFTDFRIVDLAPGGR